MEDNNVMPSKSEWIVERIDYNMALKISSPIKNIFNSPKFSELNKNKVDEVLYLLIKKGGSNRFLVTFGRRENEFLCPFSAPFGYPEPLKSSQTIENYEKAYSAIMEYLVEQHAVSVRIVLPPSYYDNTAVVAWYNIFIRNDWGILCADIDYTFNLPRIGNEYENNIAHNAKKNLRIARDNELRMIPCKNVNDKRLAYRIIEKNRQEKGYPLRMSEDEVIGTTDIVDSNMFILEHQGELIASALIYDVTKEIAMVVYWGELVEFASLKPINYIAYKLVREYFENQYEYLDIGPSTETGVPNLGLCNFKESIGCERHEKLAFNYKF